MVGQRAREATIALGTESAVHRTYCRAHAPKGEMQRTKFRPSCGSLCKLGDRGGKSNLLGQVWQPYGVQSTEMLQQRTFSNPFFAQARGMMMMMHVARRSLDSALPLNQ
jgi:hypothetical protein